MFVPALHIESKLTRGFAASLCFSWPTTAVSYLSTPSPPLFSPSKEKKCFLLNIFFKQTNSFSFFWFCFLPSSWHDCVEIPVSKFSFLCQAGNTVQENVFLRETSNGLLGMSVLLLLAAFPPVCTLTASPPCTGEVLVLGLFCEKGNTLKSGPSLRVGG